MKGLSKHNHPQTGKDYFDNHVRKTIDYYYARGVDTIWVMFDRGSPINKSIEHAKRAKNTVLMEIPDNYDKDTGRFLCDETTIPSKDEYKGYVMQPLLIWELLHYITLKFLGPIDNIVNEELKNDVASSPLYKKMVNDSRHVPGGFSHYIPPVGKTLCLHGVRAKQPSRNSAYKSKYESARLITITNNIVTSYDNGTTSTVVKKQVNVSHHYDVNVNNNINEGETGVFKYLMSYSGQERNPDAPGDDVLIHTPDGDALMMAFIASSERINVNTATFRNNVFVKLIIPGGYDQYVNVNQLWLNVLACEQSNLLKYNAKTSDLLLNYVKNEAKEYEYSLVVALSALCGLCGTDYVKNYCCGIASSPIDLCPINNRNNPLKYDSKYDVDRSKRYNTIKYNQLMEEVQHMTEEQVKMLGYDGRMRESKDLTSDKFENHCKKYDVKSIPTIVLTYLTNYVQFNALFGVQSNKLPPHRHQIHGHFLPQHFYTKVYIHEPTFILFTQTIYMTKYASSKSIQKLKGPNPSIEDVRWYLNDRLKAQHLKELNKLSTSSMVSEDGQSAYQLAMIKKTTTRYRNRMMEPRKIRVICRQLNWQLMYWLNSYKDNCITTDPLTVYKSTGLSYYGWQLNANNECVCAHRVSKLVKEACIDLNEVLDMEQEANDGAFAFKDLEEGEIGI